MIVQYYKGRTIRLNISRYSRGSEVYICIAEWDGRTLSTMGSNEAEVRKKIMTQVKRAIDEEDESESSA